MSLKKTTVLLATALLPTLSLAHSGHESGSGFMAGLAHPVAGMDHLLAMVAVGLWGAHLGGHARWQLPLAFIATMIVGTLVGVSGFAMVGAEMMIVLSVVVLGLALTLTKSIKPVVAVAVCSSFALFHGAAHGAEMPVWASVGSYAVGFTLATAALHVAGLAIGLPMKLAHRRVIQVTGALLMVAGGVMGLA